MDHEILKTYNIISEFDIPFCRNAIVFVNRNIYCPIYESFNDDHRTAYNNSNMNYDLFDQFYRDHIKINYYVLDQNDKNIAELKRFHFHS